MTFMLTAMHWIALAAVAIPAAAQPLYPAKPVRIIVPYPPGGGNDIVGRAYADELSKRGHAFIVENRSGASTIIGAELVAKAPPDELIKAIGLKDD